MNQKGEATELKDLRTLLFRSGSAVRWVNVITLYRIVTFPVLVYLAIIGEDVWFRWLLFASFFTDAIDGFLARRYQATSILGSKLDSVGDDLTVLAAAIGLFAWEWTFIKEQAAVFIVLFALFIIQIALSLFRYRKISTFHTYLAKIAAVVTALFLLSVFFTNEIYFPLFYLAAAITGIELVEEIILAAVLKDYESNVKGLYWVLRDNERKGSH